ncbi:MAG: hypothetical protein ACK4N5_17070, partial [Myxococcales bacterium]
CGVEPRELSPRMYAFQRDIVSWAIRRGRAAIFADCGMGKSLMQLEWARQVTLATGGNVLVLAPLAVAGQTVREGERFGIPARYCRSQVEVQPGITVTNYERLDAFEPAAFAGVVLDESSVLKAFMGKTKRALIGAFADTRFRLACTATPAPNDVVELGNHAEFLGVMESSQMLSRWFINDTMAAGNYRLKGHAEEDFWRWVASWAVSVASPADLGHDATGYVLPALELVEHLVRGGGAAPRDGELFGHVSVNATNLHRQLRETTAQRVAKAAELVRAEPSEAWVLWCNTNHEADALVAALPEAIEVRGSESPEEKEEKLTAFSECRSRLLITKPSIAGYGLNWQHCARHLFLGLSFSFEDFFQAVRRSYRFGQRRPMQVHVLTAEGLANVRATVAAKQEAHRRQQERMAAAMREVFAEAARTDAPTISYAPSVRMALPPWLGGHHAGA